MAYMAKGAVRSIKNFGKGYSDIQAKVRAATSNDPWGPSGRAMNEIAQATHNNHDFIEIMEMIDKRLNDSGKNWRHVFKALHLLDYCLHAGSDNVVLYAKDNLYVVKTLREFQYIDELGKDQGANVRQKAKEITNLLQDDQLLKEERRSHATMRDRMFGRHELGSDRGIGGDRTPTFEQSSYLDEDAEMKKAIEESMKSQEDYEKRKKQNKKEEEEMAKAIQLSKEEEEKRKRAEESARHEQSLFGDASVTSTPFQQQQSQTDFFNTLNDQFTTTQFNQFGNNSVQQTPYEIFNLENQQNLNAAQFSTNPYQQQLLQLQQQNNAYQQQLSLQQLPSVATTVGSNNPFGPFTQQQATFGNTSSLGTSGSLSSLGNDSLQLQVQQTSFGSPAFNSPSASNLTTFDSTLANQQQSNNEKQQLLLQQQFKKPQTIQDEKFAKLNELLAKGEGQDTFGNVGDLRVPVGTGFSNTLSAPLRSNSINSSVNNTLTQGNPFFKSEGNAPHSGTFSNSQPNLTLGAQPINNTDLFSGTFSGGSSSSYTSGLNTPSSPFSTASSYAATSNSLIDLGPNANDFGQTSKNPFQQNTNPLLNANKPQSLNELQQQQQGFNPYGQQNANFGIQGFNGSSSLF